jgi:UDP-N-acetyl-D-mannosaminuronic acid dehydrogenase
MTDGDRTCVVMGLGYIGLPTAAVMAQTGIEVTGVDIDPQVVRAVNEGACLIPEQGLPELVRSVARTGRLTARNAPVPADVFIIAVPTPFLGGYKPDLSHVEAAAHAIAPVLHKGCLVIVESTIPVGATEQVGRWLAQDRADLTISRRGMSVEQHCDVLVAHCPERTLPGRMLHELVENDRIIGGLCPASARRADAFYRRFVKGPCHLTDARTAELCKLTENAYRDVNIAFANELSVICEEAGISVWELIELANRHPRVNVLKPGPGVGGHCIAVDPWFIVSALADKTRLIREARWINSSRPRHVVRKVLEQIERTGAPPAIACFGLSYKADVGDVRESPAVEVVELLARELQMQAPCPQILVVEPHIGNALPASLERLGVRLAAMEDALQADLLVMLVDHGLFRELARDRLHNKVIIDTRGIWVR